MSMMVFQPKAVDTYEFEVKEFESELATIEEVAQVAQVAPIKVSVEVFADLPGDEPEVSIEMLLNKYDWPVWKARKVMMCESGGDPENINDTPATYDYSVGLFQINLFGSLQDHRPSEEWLKVPENNLDYAYKLWSETRSFKRHWVNCSKGL